MVEVVASRVPEVLELRGRAITAQAESLDQWTLLVAVVVPEAPERTPVEVPEARAEMVFLRPSQVRQSRALAVVAADLAGLAVPEEAEATRHLEPSTQAVVVGTVPLAVPDSLSSQYQKTLSYSSPLV